MFRGEAEESLEIYRDEMMYVATAMTPIRSSRGDTVAVAAADVSMPGIREAFMRLLSNLALSVIAIMIVIMLLYYQLVRKQIISPIQTLQTTAEKLVENINREENLEIPIHTGDELDLLARSYEDMVRKLKEYIRENEAVTAEKQRIGAELDMAANIQANMLPNTFPAFPKRSEFDLYATMDPAKEVGGDFYDFFLVDDDHLVLVVADVSGKGVPAALFMMTARTLIKDAALEGLDPSSVMFRVNERLDENNKDGLFVTVWLGILTISTGELTYSDAGHEKLLLYQQGAWRFLPKGGCTALAVLEPDEFDDLPESYRYRNETVRLQSGDMIFQYTDGVTEATDAQEELFGDERLLTAMNDAGDNAPESLLPHLRRRIDEFVKDAPQFDDITMLGLRYRGRVAK